MCGSLRPGTAIPSCWRRHVGRSCGRGDFRCQRSWRWWGMSERLDCRYRSSFDYRSTAALRCRQSRGEPGVRQWQSIRRAKSLGRLSNCRRFITAASTLCASRWLLTSIAEFCCTAKPQKPIHLDESLRIFIDFCLIWRGGKRIDFHRRQSEKSPRLTWFFPFSFLSSTLERDLIIIALLT